MTKPGKEAGRSHGRLKTSLYVTFDVLLHCFKYLGHRTLNPKPQIPINIYNIPLAYAT